MKDVEVAKKMTKFIELNTIGVSKDSQLRAAKVLRTVSDSCEQERSSHGGESFFKYSFNLMSHRWNQLRATVERSEMFSLPRFSPAYCTFFSQVLEPQPGNDQIHKINANYIDETIVIDHEIILAYTTSPNESEYWCWISMSTKLLSTCTIYVLPPFLSIRSLSLI